MQNATTCATPAASAVDRLWRAGCSDKLHAQFGEGWLEKEHLRATSLASYSTVRAVLRRGERSDAPTYSTTLPLPDAAWATPSCVTLTPTPSS